MQILVQKFGGTSLADANLIKNVAQRVVNAKKKGYQVVVVVSACGHSTDELLQLAKSISSHPSEREIDMLLATGEQVSIALLAMAIEKLGYSSISFTGYQAGIFTDKAHTKARIIKIQPDSILKALKEDKIVVVAGFQGMSEEMEITTLGRGGSDTTAVALAAALNAEMCEIYTDVEGVYTADPRLITKATKLNKVSYEEMLELASLGALVLQPRAVEFAKYHKVTLHVRSSFCDSKGTLVEEAVEMEKYHLVSGVAHDLNVAKIGIFNLPDEPGVAKRLFKVLADNHINVDMIIQSWMYNGKNDIAFTVTRDDLEKTLPVVEQVSKELNASGTAYNDHVAKVSIVGASMVTNPGVAATMFEALADEGINIEMISTSEIKISCVIAESQALQAVKVLHAKFFEEEA